MSDHYNIPVLMRIEEWIKFRFTSGSKPDTRTVHNWIKNGDVPGKQIGKLWFIEAQREVMGSPEDLLTEAMSGTKG